MVDVNKKMQEKGRLLRGTVVSDKMEKTLVVSVGRTYIDPRFGKVIRNEKRYKVHYEAEEPVSVGDTVEIIEGRPISKTKYMYVTKVIARHHDSKRD